MKYIVLLAISLSLSACSESNDKDESLSCWMVTIETECGNFDTQNKFTVTEDVYQEEIIGEWNGNSCTRVSFKDVDNNTVSGYYRSGSKRSCD